MYYFTVFFIILALSMIHLINGGVQEDVLIEHNRLRRLHGVPDLELDNDLCSGAQNQAKKMRYLDEIEFSDPSEDFDENICCDYVHIYNPIKCVQEWYENIKYYDFDKAEHNPEANIFIAIVWKESNKLGVGQAKGNDSKGEQMCLVARYFPCSYADSDFKENVPRLIAETSDTSIISTAKSTNSSSILWNPFKCLVILSFSWLAIWLMS